jgi:Tfp pilus assembly protein FimT
MGIAVAYTNGADIVAYQPDGQPVTRGTWYFSSGTNARAVVINFLGRVRICNRSSTTSAAGPSSSEVPGAAIRAFVQSRVY